MQITIIDTPWQKTLLGVSKRHDPAMSYGDEIRQQLGPVWEAVRRDQIAVTGINHVLYGEQQEVFCGLECSGETVPVPGLDLRRIELAHYAYYRHPARTSRSLKFTARCKPIWAVWGCAQSHPDWKSTGIGMTTRKNW